MAVRLSESEYQGILRKQGKVPTVSDRQPEKRHKYAAQKVTIDGHIFPSKLEGKCYIDLKWQSLAGLITFPLLQVWFSLGEWLPLGAKKPKSIFYVADFVYVDLTTGCLIVADAKGYVTEEYQRKRDVFEQIYRMSIVELGKSYRKK
jgi:hypothetical protein